MTTNGHLTTSHADTNGHAPLALSPTQVHGQLIPLDEAKRSLAAEFDISRVANFTKAVEAAKMIDGKNAERRNYWGELAIWSTKRLGQLIIDGQKKGEIEKRGGDKKSKSHDVTLKLDEMGVSRMQSSRWQKSASVH